MTGDKTRKGGNTHLGEAPPDHWIYKDRVGTISFGQHLTKLLKKPTSGTPPTNSETSEPAKQSNPPKK